MWLCARFGRGAMVHDHVSRCRESVARQFIVELDYNQVTLIDIFAISDIAYLSNR